ncbi:dihydroorotase [Aridibaculum aurantiacum]|uniref:dihydroorotase n=1 Tax=Aridibaculum aurantiacum TaxID=2810307 RepID=UPI001A958C34|nr:dihydroorotase [Aridibaculum aurantiacum]
MKLLLKQVTICDKLSPHNGSTKDILIINGKITSIEDSIDAGDAEVIEEKDVLVSPGWVDVFAHFNDPGNEYKETIETGIEAATAGGYTNVFVLPNTNPVVGNKSLVEYIAQKAKHAIVNVFPLGSITKNAEGKELAEMYDMRKSGAIAFTDGTNPVQTPGLFLKALQYVRAFDGTLIQLPIDRSIGKHGLMNEGITSTRLGLPGLPAIAEELIITRDIELTKYTGSKLHITGVSTAKGLALIAGAKAAGVKISCSVTPYHLFFCDEDLVTYDTNLKVDPPLRTRQDMVALREGVLNGTIDCISSHHLPQDWDHKVCEFEYAQPGINALQSTFNVINHTFPALPVDRLIEILSTKARQLFSLQQNAIDVNNDADLTIFTRSGETTLTTETNKSRSNNNPFINLSLRGAVLGVINKEKKSLNINHQAWNQK